MLSEQVTELRLEYREGLVMQRSRSEQRQREELLQSPRGSKEKNLRREGRALRWRRAEGERPEGNRVGEPEDPIRNLSTTLNRIRDQGMIKRENTAFRTSAFGQNRMTGTRLSLPPSTIMELG